MAELAKYRKEETTPIQASVRELQRNAPTGEIVDAVQAPGKFVARGMGQLADAAVLAPLRGDFSAFAPSTYIDAIADSSVGRRLDASMQTGQTTLGMPESSIRETERVRRLLNPSGSGVVPETIAPAAAAAIPQVARGLRDAVAPSIAAASQGPVAPPDLGTAPELMSSPRNDRSYRIVRRAGHSPILTNVADPISEAYKGDNFIEADGKRTDFFGGVPANIPAARGVSDAPADPAPQRATTALEAIAATGQGNPRLEQPAARAPRTPADFLSGVNVPRGGEEAALGLATRFANMETATANRAENLAQRDRMYALRARQTDINQQTADAATANAGLTGVRAQVELTKLNKELGTNLKAYYKEVTDPKTFETTKELAGFVSEGGNNPVSIPLEELNAYRQALINAPDDKTRAQIKAQFNAYYPID